MVVLTVRIRCPKKSGTAAEAFWKSPPRPSGVWVVPPLVVTRAEIDWFCDAIADSLKLADPKVKERGR
jgi:hypothetical protein